MLRPSPMPESRTTKAFKFRAFRVYQTYPFKDLYKEVMIRNPRIRVGS